jgi:putative intracellular protease/amidase
MKKPLILGALCAATFVPATLLSVSAFAQDESTVVKGSPRPMDGSLAPNATTVFPAPKVTRPLKIAIYEGQADDKGVRNVCARVDQLGNAVITPLKPEEFSTTDLSKYDVVVFSGGSGSAQAKAIGETGREKVRQFVKDGGSYLGICAGAYLATAGYPWSLGILNAKTIQPWARGKAFLKIQLTDEGRAMFGDVKEPFSIRYNNGPVIEPANSPDLPPYTVRAYFRNEVADKGPLGVMVNSPAVVTGIYGKGRVLSISPHSEDSKGLENFLPWGMKWLAGETEAK